MAGPFHRVRRKVNWTPSHLFLWLLVAVGCAAPDTQGIRLIGHGGLGPAGEQPMNSEAAIRKALDKGLEGVEMDVQLTADSVLVAHHDLQLHGPTCLGRIADHQWRSLKACADPGVQGAFQGVRLDSLLARLALEHPQAEFTLDVKLDTGDDWWTYLHRFSRALARLQRDAGLSGRLIVECRVVDLLRALTEDAPALPTYLIADAPEPAVATALGLRCAGITMPVDALNAEEAAQVHEAGLKLTVYGVAGRWSMQQAVRLDPDRIQVDE